MPHGYTSGDFVRMRFGRAGWIVFLGISFFYALGWLVSMGMAGGILLESLTGIDYRVGMVTVIVVCTGYTMLGGLRAVIGTDFIQSVLILLGLVIVGVAAFTTASPSEVHARLAEDRPALLDLLAPASIMFLFNHLLFGLGEIFHSNVWWSRAHAFREDVGGRAFFWGGVLWLPVPVLAGSVALVAPLLGVDVPSLDMVGPLVIGELLGSTGAVLLLIVVISSLASSLDSLLAATSDLFVEDVYRRLLRPGARDSELRSASLWLIFALGIVTIALCWQRLATLGEVLNLTGAFVASTIWPIAAGLYFRATNARAATAAMIVGSAAGLTAYFTIGFFTAALVSAAASMLITLFGTWAAPARFDFALLDAEVRR